jgi:hypothetical protein
MIGTFNHISLVRSYNRIMEDDTSEACSTDVRDGTYKIYSVNNKGTN